MQTMILTNKTWQIMPTYCPYTFTNISRINVEYHQTTSVELQHYSDPMEKLFNLQHLYCRTIVIKTSILKLQYADYIGVYTYL